MGLSQIDRSNLIIPVTVVAQDFLAARTESSAEAATYFTCPWAGIVRGVQAALGTFPTGTTKTWTVSVTDAVPTTIVTLTALTNSVLTTRTKDLAFKVSEGQVLTINHVFGNTDCVTEGNLVIIEFQILADL